MGLAPQWKQFFHRVLGDIAGAGDGRDLARDDLATGGQHLLGEIDGAIAGRLGTQQRAAKRETLARQYAVKAVGDPLVLTKEVANLATTDADIAGRYVRIGADMAIQLGHEGLAEAHDLIVALALGIEVRTAFAAAHGEGGEAILEDLFKGEKLEDAEGDGGVKAQAALIGSNGAVHFDAVAAIDLHLALVVEPGDAEHDHTLGFHQSIQDARLAIGLVGLDHRID